MTLPIPYFRPTAPEFSACGQTDLVADARWHQWIFKAPPLRVQPPQVDLHELSAALPARAEPAR